MKKQNSMNRRSLLKHTAQFAGLASTFNLAKSFFTTEALAAEIPKDYVLASSTEGTPKVLQYVEDASKANPAIRKDKTAFCRNCAQYAKTHAEFKHPRDGKVATCDSFVTPQNTKLYVKSEGWCMAFQKATTQKATK